MNANENASEARAKQVALDTKDRINRKGRERAEKGESGTKKKKKRREEENFHIKVFPLCIKGKDEVHGRHTTTEQAKR